MSYKVNITGGTTGDLVRLSEGLRTDTVVGGAGSVTPVDCGLWAPSLSLRLSNSIIISVWGQSESPHSIAKAGTTNTSVLWTLLLEDWFIVLVVVN